MPIQAAFVQQAGEPVEYELLLINRTGVSLTFRWEMNIGGQRHGSGTGHVAGEDFAILTRVPLDALNEKPAIVWEIWPEEKTYLPFSRVHRIKASSFYTGRRFIEELGTEAHVLEVVSKLSQKPEEKEPDLTWLDEKSWPKMEEFKRTEYGSDISSVNNEIDLHIEELRSDHATMTPGEMVVEQVKACDAFLQRALMAGHHSVYIIHGMGSGRLRQAIHTLLTGYPHVRSYRNAYHPRYGLGATEVRF